MYYISHMSYEPWKKKTQNSQRCKDLLSISQCSHTMFANSQYPKIRGKTFQVKTNLVGYDNGFAWSVLNEKKKKNI